MSAVSYPETLRSPSDVSSRSVSPVVLLPATTPTPQYKQKRSSSMNLVGSSHSATNRSMSIVSVESARNSIVSVEDFCLKVTRNNSASSLASLNGVASPLETKKECSWVGHRLVKSKTKSACAIFSDEESSELEQTQALSRSAAWRRRRSSDHKHKPDFLMSFKNNFKFKYDNYVKPKSPVSGGGGNNGGGNISSTPKIEDPMPSPLSSAVEGQSLHSQPSLSSLESETLPPPARPQVSLSAKKVRSSSMTQLMFWKRKLLLSKDIQFELLLTHTSTTATYPPANSNTPEMRSHGIFLPQSVQGHALDHGLTSSTRPAEVMPRAGPKYLGSSPHHHQHLHYLSSTMTSSTTSSSFASPASPPTELTLRQQNKLISELNRKWNRAMYLPAMDEFAQHEANSLEFPSGSLLVSKKRGRSELSSSTDSLATNY